IGLKYCIIVQGTSEMWWPNDESAEKLLRAYSGAARTFFVCQANLDVSHRQFGVPLATAAVVRNPYNVSYNANPAWPSEAPELSLAFVARLDVATKGHDALFQVLALPHWRSRNITVSLVGDGNCERGLRRLADQLRLTSIRFLGHQGDIESV